MKGVISVLLANTCLAAVALLFLATGNEPIGSPASGPIVEATFTAD